jgi:PhnB protein
MQLIAYLNFNGNCREAFDFYRDVFKGDITMRMTYGESPMRDQMSADDYDQIMHNQLEADGPPPHDANGGNTCININVQNVDEAERIFHALSAGGEVQMPLQETFWAHRWAAFSDRFGKPWMINCMKEA